jgi:hypothetical protein
MGVSYWGQIQFVLYLFFAVIASELAFAHTAQRARSRERAEALAVAPPLGQEPVES